MFQTFNATRWDINSTMASAQLRSNHSFFVLMRLSAVRARGGPVFPSLAGIAARHLPSACNAGAQGLFHCNRGTLHECTMARRDNLGLNVPLPFYPNGGAAFVIKQAGKHALHGFRALCSASVCRLKLPQLPPRSFALPGTPCAPFAEANGSVFTLSQAPCNDMFLR